jgi:hypothetical protein
VPIASSARDVSAAPPARQPGKAAKTSAVKTSAIAQKVLVFMAFLEYHICMSDGNNTDILGKKIFFLHPSAFVQNEILTELIQLEYEVYVVKDENALLRVLNKYPHSIVFCSVDEVLDVKGWESLIRRIMDNPETKDTAIGAIAASEDEAAKRFYVSGLKLPCGYVALKPDVGRAIKVLLEILKAADAKGRRKYIRADTHEDHQAVINLDLDDHYVNGSIRDISVVGLSCVFPANTVLEKNALINNIQIKLQSFLLKAEGIVFGSRTEGEETSYVIVFTQKIDPLVRIKIRTYMQKVLQAKMDQEMK